jgi:hypothetical protein
MFDQGQQFGRGGQSETLRGPFAGQHLGDGQSLRLGDVQPGQAALCIDRQQAIAGVAPIADGQGRRVRTRGQRGRGQRQDDLHVDVSLMFVTRGAF